MSAINTLFFVVSRLCGNDENRRVERANTPEVPCATAGWPSTVASSPGNDGKERPDRPSSFPLARESTKSNLLGECLCPCGRRCHDAASRRATGCHSGSAPGKPFRGASIPAEDGECNEVRNRHRPQRAHHRSRRSREGGGGVRVRLPERSGYAFPEPRSRLHDDPGRAQHQQDPHRAGGYRSGNPPPPGGGERRRDHRRAVGRARLRRHRYLGSLGQAHEPARPTGRAARGGDLHPPLHGGREGDVARASNSSPNGPAGNCPSTWPAAGRGPAGSRASSPTA